MDQLQSSFLPLPIELIFKILLEIDDKGITSVASLNKTHLDFFKRSKGVYQRLVCQICFVNIQECSNEVYDWSREFKIISFYNCQIRNNQLADPREIEQMKKAYDIEESVKLLPKEIESQEAPGSRWCIRQSQMPLYPLPVGDFSVAYYEVDMISNEAASASFNIELHGCREKIEVVGIGASLFGFVGVPGSARNTFGILSSGCIGLENYTTLKNERVVFKVEEGDYAGFGIDFKKNSIFFTKNGELVYETSKNFLNKQLLNLKALHAQICIQLNDEVEKDFEPLLNINFGQKEFAFDVLRYQATQNSKENLRTYSSVIVDHLLCEPDYETIETYESDPERIEYLQTMMPQFPSNVKIESIRNFDFLYEMLFFRDSFLDLPEVDQITTEFDQLQNTAENLARVLSCRWNTAYLQPETKKLIEESGGVERFVKSLYVSFAWDFCEAMLGLIPEDKKILVWQAFDGNQEWAFAMICYIVVINVKSENGGNLIGSAANKLLSKILGISEPQRAVGYDAAFCQYCLTKVRWLAIKTLIEKRSGHWRQQFATIKETELKTIFGDVDPVTKLWRKKVDMARNLQEKKDGDDEYVCMKTIALMYFHKGREFVEKWDINKLIEIENEDELLQIQVFYTLLKEEIFGIFEGTGVCRDCPNCLDAFSD